MAKSIEFVLARIRENEPVPHPAPIRRAATRARLLAIYPETWLHVLQTRIGWIGVAWTAQGIITLELPRPSREQMLKGLQKQFTDGVIAEAPTEMRKELTEYAEGQRRVFDLPLDWSLVKPFQRAVLIVANKIPFGETRTYGWVAKQIGKPQAARAVGRALATNPIPLILPCHRVVGSNGSLTGYGGGLLLKRRLLEMEGALLGGA